ncbi:O-antigen ligase family protein [Fervidobacterium pennivorans subsp. carthaginiensis]|uniref:O-antigen ligase family protein n=1 Tax=Fervidobacterium pennivorans TaxID=93466 RepID=UPI00355C9C11
MKISSFSMSSLFYLVIGFVLNLFIFSYSIEGFYLTIDITVFSFALLVALLTLFYLSRLDRQTIIITSVDVSFLALITYLMAHHIFVSDPVDLPKVVLRSLTAYVIGRMISEKMLTGGIIVTMPIYVLAILNGLTSMFVRLNTFYQNPNADLNRIGAGEAVGILVVYLFCTLTSPKNRYLKVVAVLLAFVLMFLFATVLSGRGAVLFSSISYPLALLLTRRKNSVKSIVKPMLVILALVILFIFVIPGILSKYFPSIGRYSFQAMLSDPSVTGNSQFVGRFDLYRESLEIISRHFFFGAGSLAVYSHNLFLETFASYGFLGLLLLVLFLVELLRQLLKLKRSFPVLFVVSAFIFTFLYRMTSFGWTNHKTMFLFAGLVVSMASSSTRSKHGTELKVSS